jgi:hypothetical protein
MTGVTIVTPSYKHLYAEAAKRFRKNTGLPVHAIRVADSRGFAAKLELDRLAPRGPIVFFDVDAWVIQPTDFSKLTGGWFAVNDPAVYTYGSFPKEDCEEFSIPKGFYFNSGVMALDTSDRTHRKVFKLARKLKASGRYEPKDWTDQFWLNLAALQCEVPIQHIPLSFNYYPMAVKHGGYPHHPRTPKIVHAAGFKLPHKLDALRAMEVVFGYDARPMVPEAITAYHNRTHD